MEAEIVYFSFVDKATGCLGILARFTLTKVANPYIFLFLIKLPPSPISPTPPLPQPTSVGFFFYSTYK